MAQPVIPFPIAQARGRGAVSRVRRPPGLGDRQTTSSLQLAGGRRAVRLFRESAAETGSADTRPVTGPNALPARLVGSVIPPLWLPTSDSHDHRHLCAP